jgi:hypothetical protein
VKKFADTNSQKLRQIGINHDIANAKGLEPEDMKTMDEMQKEAEKEAEKEEEKPKKKKKKSVEKKDKEEKPVKEQDEAEDKSGNASTAHAHEKLVHAAAGKPTS